MEQFIIGIPKGKQNEHQNFNSITEAVHACDYRCCCIYQESYEKALLTFFSLRKRDFGPKKKKKYIRKK